MRVCMIGKFPPIQGGVSMRTYWTAHALAARGHDVHVVTNAKEVVPPFRMHMRPEDWARCESRGHGGSVKVHWTEPVDRSQSYIPMASPFVSKLASIAKRVHSAHPFDVIFSHYMEPYGIAGYIASQMTGAPHVVRMAGSDAGRLWRHPQLENLYDHVLQSAQFVVAAAGEVRERAIERGVDPTRIVSGGAYSLPEDLFTPEGVRIDFASFRNEVEQDAVLRDALWGGFAGGKPHFGIYGKLGDNKGSFALLTALHRLKCEGLEFGLVALAHARADVESRFRQQVGELGLSDNVLQIPFIPHWRVPEFLRGCLAVCCLEQDFPIGFHSPIIPLEILLCGSCLVASTEVIRKLPRWERLPHGYGCVAINDVNDVEELSAKLSTIVRRPQTAAIVGARGRAFALDVQRGVDFPARLELVLAAAAERRAPPAESSGAMSDRAGADRFRLTRMAGLVLKDIRKDAIEGPDLAVNCEIENARQIYTALQNAVMAGNTSLESLAKAVEVELAIADAEEDEDGLSEASIDPLFRIRIDEWALDDGGMGMLTPIRNPRSRILRFDLDVSEFLRVATVADAPTSLNPGPSYVIVFIGNGAPSEPLLVDPTTARILELCDGTRTCSDIAGQLGRAPDSFLWMEHLLVSGLISLHRLTGC